MDKPRDLLFYDGKNIEHLTRKELIEAFHAYHESVEAEKRINRGFNRVKKLLENA